MAKRTRESNASGGTRGSDAFKLMESIARVEGKSFDHGAENAVDRQWILDTYRQCRLAALGKEPPPVVHLTIYDTAPG
jgi:hypothetical protein